jgi:hypothetical protein
MFASAYYSTISSAMLPISFAAQPDCMLAILREIVHGLRESRRKFIIKVKCSPPALARDLQTHGTSMTDFVASESCTIPSTSVYRAGIGDVTPSKPSLATEACMDVCIGENSIY